MKKYNICFEMGDPSNDGHGHYDTFHMVSNYSTDQIAKAYKKAVKQLGFDYVKEIGVEYECDTNLDSDQTKALIDYGIVVHFDDDYTDEDYENDDVFYGTYDDPDDPESGIIVFDDAITEFIMLFNAIIRKQLPDFYMYEREIREDSLSILDGACYGWY